MKRRIILKRFVAMLVLIAILVTGIPFGAVYASEENIVKSILEELQNASEESLEAILDSSSHISSGNWWIATKYDKLPWNFFS